MMITSRLFHIALMTTAIALLAGCMQTQPRYQTSYQYQFPDDSNAQACINHCRQQLRVCQQQCSSKQQACLQHIKPQVEQLYANELEHYQQALNLYRIDLERYQLQLIIREQRARLQAEGRVFWPEPWYMRPIAPFAPSKSRIQQQLAAQCDLACRCQTELDSCYLSCGVKKISETRCVSDCPAATSP